MQECLWELRLAAMCRLLDAHRSRLCAWQREPNFDLVCDGERIVGDVLPV